MTEQDKTYNANTAILIGVIGLCVGLPGLHFFYIGYYCTGFISVIGFRACFAGFLFLLGPFGIAFPVIYYAIQIISLFTLSTICDRLNKKYTKINENKQTEQFQLK